MKMDITAHAALTKIVHNAVLHKKVYQHDADAGIPRRSAAGTP
jgi:hypothetical protein